MRVSRLAIVLAALLVGSSVAVAAEPAAGCTAGSAWRAGPQRPHAADLAGDATAPDPALDMRAVWIGVHPGTAGEPVYTATMQLQDLSGVRPGSSFEIRVLGGRLNATVGLDGTWSFSQTDVWFSTVLLPNGQHVIRPVAGEVLLAENQVVMTIPADLVAASPSTWSSVSAATSLRIGGAGTPAPQSMVMLMDGWAEHTCQAEFDGLPPA